MTDHTAPTRPSLTTPRRRSRRRPVAPVAAALVGGGLIIVQPTPASAGVNVGVHSVSLVADPVECTIADDNCPDGGPWASNTVHLFQSQVDGQWRFDTIAGSTDDAHVRFQQDVGVDCEFGYHVNSATIRSGHDTYDGLDDNHTPEVGGLGYVVESFPVGGEPNAISMSMSMSTNCCTRSTTSSRWLASGPTRPIPTPSRGFSTGPKSSSRSGSTAG